MLPADQPQIRRRSEKIPTGMSVKTSMSSQPRQNSRTKSCLACLSVPVSLATGRNAGSIAVPTNHGVVIATSTTMVVCAPSCLVTKGSIASSKAVGARFMMICQARRFAKSAAATTTTATIPTMSATIRSGG